MNKRDRQRYAHLVSAIRELQCVRCGDFVAYDEDAAIDLVESAVAVRGPEVTLDMIDTQCDYCASGFGFFIISTKNVN